MTIIITNIITIILSVLIVLALGTLNTILTKEARERELSFKEIIAENQDTKVGKILMSIVSFPTAITLKILSKRDLKTHNTTTHIQQGTYVYVDEGSFGSFYLNIADYNQLRDIIEDLPKEENEEVLIVCPKTLKALCQMTDGIDELGLKSYEFR